jgi:diguanylate cyclase (GGDEF)-like protein
LDGPTLSFVAIYVTTLLGLFLIFAWLQQKDARALAWWGSAYMISAASMALWNSPAPMYAFPRELPASLIFVACGLTWNGVRLFHRRKPLPAAIFAGAIAWLVLCQIPALMADNAAHLGLGAIIVAGYTVFIIIEFWRERRQSLYSQTGAIMVTCLHAGIFLMPLALQTVRPDLFASDWLTLFALETIIYAVGTAFIMLLVVKDHHVHFYRKAATIDSLTGLLNRGAFMECAIKLCAHQGQRGNPVTLMMFDLDHFKSINDRFGHAVGDGVLRVFAQVARKSMRTSDVIGRLGGEEFAAIVPEGMDVAKIISERLRSGFEDAGATVGAHAIGATVSIGAAMSYEAVTNIDALIVRADDALYRAKHDGRNRMHAADDESASEQARQIAAACRGQDGDPARLLQRKSVARRGSRTVPEGIVEVATPRLL